MIENDLVRYLLQDDAEIKDELIQDVLLKEVKRLSGLIANLREDSWANHGKVSAISKAHIEAVRELDMLKRQIAEKGN